MFHFDLNKIVRVGVVFLLVLSFVVPSDLFVFAQTGMPLTAERQAQLKAELEAVEREIAAQQVILDAKKRETGSIERDIAILDTKISQAKLIIKAKTILIEQLGKDITGKTKTIATLSEKMENSQVSLAQLIRKTNQLDNISLAEILLGNHKISDVYGDFDQYQAVQSSLTDVYNDTKETRQLTEAQRAALDKRRKAEIDAEQVIAAEKKSIEKDEAEKQKLLKLNKTQEKAYQTVLDDRKARAAQIRTALFALRDTAAIPFGRALELATSASVKTGVRPAFILAILTQETNLGQNVGTCNRAGDPPAKGWREIMKPTRDQEPYLKIIAALGLNPDTMPLSCPMAGGWGGAMGPSQFIPSTWMAFVPQLSKLLGVEMPNPWEPAHAFMATAIYLQELGADAQTYSAEREAALRYYAGGGWNKPQNAFYGNQVMAKAKNIQENMIDPLQNL